MKLETVSVGVPVVPPLPPVPPVPPLPPCVVPGLPPPPPQAASMPASSRPPKNLTYRFIAAIPPDDVYCLCFVLAAGGGAFGHHLRRDEDEHFLLVRAAGPALEGIAHHRDVAQQRNARFAVALGQLEDAADDDRAAVLHQHLRLDVLGVDGDTGRRGLAAAVLGDVEFENDVALGRDLRRHL